MAKWDILKYLRTSNRMLFGLPTNGSRIRLWVEFIFVAVGTPVTRRPPHRSVRAELLHTAPTSDTWRRSAGLGGDEGSWHSESSDRPTTTTAPTSSGLAGSAAAAHDASAKITWARKLLRLSMLPGTA